MKYYVEAWNKGNGMAYRAYVEDCFQAICLFNASCRAYNRVKLVNDETGQVEREYNNA